MLYRRVFNLPTWRRGSPFDELENMRRQMDRLLGDMGTRPFQAPRAGVYPLLNLTEDKNSYYIRAELPGLKADDLDIQATGNGISISGERKIPPENENAKYHRKEREAGKFSRILDLPNEINASKTEASLVDGILTLVIPKAEQAKPRQITVK
jgi:HSP20 family protein